MYLRLSANSEVFSLRQNGPDTELVWSTNLNLSCYTHVAVTSCKIWPLTHDNHFIAFGCNLVQSDILNPRGIIHVVSSTTKSQPRIKGLSTLFSCIKLHFSSTI